MEYIIQTILDEDFLDSKIHDWENTDKLSDLLKKEVIRLVDILSSDNDIGILEKTMIKGYGVWELVRKYMKEWVGMKEWKINQYRVSFVNHDSITWTVPYLCQISGKSVIAALWHENIKSVILWYGNIPIANLSYHHYEDKDAVYIKQMQGGKIFWDSGQIPNYYMSSFDWKRVLIEYVENFFISEWVMSFFIRGSKNNIYEEVRDTPVWYELYDRPALEMGYTFINETMRGGGKGQSWNYVKHL